MTAAARLAVALDDLADQRVFPPCTADPEAWFEGGPRKLARAALKCAGCPVLEACRAAGEEADEQFGIWGGVIRDRAALRAMAS